ncbi:hypothetical protein TG4357_00479 [Thalassovita gelatinovora]|uniref:Helix-turn-helix domain protein n=1 Tax=Thalassovita gelatinovora TaxID=53501 RepID=A0A0N7LUC3_THAGE|nr:hypothetical protein [Thalassovita gelatinovora]QIZ79597.1 hypothetical protein HFZ77_03430 [Thalassovita gelatinovora]CUH63098.1 hypothetical protein TG4357_00479 [Thalassovita gelatinovora]SEQ15787.1 hypothetical protein SAMN04488043_103379 [Thalassovita gelatinovora]
MPETEDNAPKPSGTPLKDLLTTKEVAALTGHPATTLMAFRNRRNNTKYKNAGPDYVKIGTAVFYERSVIEAYNAKRAGA